jgi:branched-chain amino acid aminotransferase
MGVPTHAGWLGASVFDGARAFEGVTPDLDLHFERVNGKRPLDRTFDDPGLSAIVQLLSRAGWTRVGYRAFAQI